MSLKVTASSQRPLASWPFPAAAILAHGHPHSAKNTATPPRSCLFPGRWERAPSRAPKGETRLCAHCLGDQAGAGVSHGQGGDGDGNCTPFRDHHEPSRQPVPSAARRWEMLHTPQPPCRGWSWFREPESNKLLRDGEAGSSPPSGDHTERTPARGMSLPSLPAPVPWAPKVKSWVS